MTPCPRCHRATVDGLLCGPCGDDYLRALGVLASLLPELEVTVQRGDVVARAVQHRHGGVDVLDQHDEPGPAHRSPLALVAHALPVNLPAADLHARTLRRLTRWHRDLEPALRTAQPDETPDRPPAGPACQACTHPVCRWLRRDTDGPWCATGGLRCLHPRCWTARAGRRLDTAALAAVLPDLRRHPSAGRIVDDVVDTTRDVELAVDRRDPEVYCGPCTRPDVTVTLEAGTIFPTVALCHVDMYAAFGDETVTCPACRAAYPIGERRSWMLDAVRDVWARPGLIAQALGALDIDLTAARLDTWISRDKRRHESCWPGVACGHLLAVAVDDAGRPMYRVGDVLDRADQVRGELERQGRAS